MSHRCVVTGFAVAVLIAFGSVSPAPAADVAGVRFDDVVKVSSTELALNGVGVATKSTFKTYAAALYLSSPKRTTAEVLAAGGPLRLRLVMVRDIPGESFASEVVDGLSRNADKATRTATFTQVAVLGKALASQTTYKKGDSVTIDWVPGAGTSVVVNGRSIAEPLPDKVFFNALLRVWLGDRPANATLKAALLGPKTS